VSAVYDAAPRNSFVVALKDIPEVWEISYDPKAEPIYDGLVHDYKMGESIAKPGYLGVRRTPLDEPLDDFFFDQSYRHVLGSTRPKTDGTPTAQVVNLDVRRKIAELPIAGMPHLGSGITFAWKGTTVLASPNLKDGAIDVIDMATGSGDHHSHARARLFHAQPRKHALRLDRLDDEPHRQGHADAHRQDHAAARRHGARAGQDAGAHVEFTRDGRYALASVWEMEGASSCSMPQTLKEVKRLPMSKPVGKYNVWNKIRAPKAPRTERLRIFGQIGLIIQQALLSNK
jgi:hypothetical protein